MTNLSPRSIAGVPSGRSASRLSSTLWSLSLRTTCMRPWCNWMATVWQTKKEKFCLLHGSRQTNFEQGNFENAAPWHVYWALVGIWTASSPGPPSLPSNWDMKMPLMYPLCSEVDFFSISSCCCISGVYWNSGVHWNRDVYWNRGVVKLRFP